MLTNKMDPILDDVVSPAELQESEGRYNQQRRYGDVTYDCQFQYAQCLVRSQYPADIQRGVHLLEDLFSKNEKGRRDYLYFLAIGHARIKKYQKSLSCLRTFQEIEPNNRQVNSLMTLVKQRLNDDGRNGMIAAGVGAGILTVGAAVLAGVLLSKNNQRK